MNPPNRRPNRPAKQRDGRAAKGTPLSLPGLLARGLRLHQTGKLADAKQIYRQILKMDPRNSDSLHLLGLIEDRLGNHKAAVESIRQAIAINPTAAVYLSNLGAILQAQGNREEALSCFERALALKPENPEACSNLGNAHLAAGNLDAAIGCYERALIVKPNYLEAHNNLGIALVAKGRIVEGISHYKRALEIDPTHANAHNNLGIALAKQDRTAEAIAHYRRALELNPDHEDAHNNLGVVLSDQGKSDEAVVHFEHALRLNPNHADVLNNLGNTCKELGKFADAMAHYDRAIVARPDFAEAHWNRAEIKSFQSGDGDLRDLESLAHKKDLSTNQETHIHFALAKAFEDVGDYTRAFAHLRKGNALKRQQIHYDEASVIGLFQRISDVFDRAVFDRFHGAGDPSSIPIFVLGMPRSGSSLIEQILAGHPQIHGAGELTNLSLASERATNTTGQMIEYPEFVRAVDETLLRTLGTNYLAGLPVVADGITRIVDKSPGNFLRIGLIRLILPNARIIHTVRDPADTCVSCYFKLFRSSLDFSYDLTELGRYYRGYGELMTHWRSVLPSDAILDVSYEAVVDDLEGQARRLIDYCGLPWDDRCISFHKTSRPVKTASAAQVRQPLFRSSLQRWRKFEAEAAPLLVELGIGTRE